MPFDKQLTTLIEILNEEQANKTFPPLDTLSTNEKWEVFRGLCNERKPNPVSEDFLKQQDTFLHAWNRQEKLIKLEDTKQYGSQLFLWQGDITRLAVDGIVNAANSALLGCTKANHNCIDNMIHTKAGIQLRLACHKLMTEQGRPEPIGKAKITSAYNLPSRYVFHTVGPFIDDKGVTPLREKLLADAYLSCLRLADKYGLETLAFCCISTGEFNFPNQKAAEIAIETVQSYINKNKSSLKVIFNVFKDEDKAIYEKLLREED